MRKPPVLRSNHSETFKLILESSHKSVFLLGYQENVVQPDTLFFNAVSSNFSSLNAPLSDSAIKTSFLEPKTMPTTPLNSHEKVEQVSAYARFIVFQIDKR